MDGGEATPTTMLSTARVTMGAFSTIRCWDALESPKIMVYTVLLSVFVFSSFSFYQLPSLAQHQSLDSKAWQDMYLPCVIISWIGMVGWVVVSTFVLGATHTLYIDFLFLFFFLSAPVDWRRRDGALFLQAGRVSLFSVLARLAVLSFEYLVLWCAGSERRFDWQLELSVVVMVNDWRDAVSWGLTVEFK